MKPGGGRIGAIDALRGVAVLTVLVGHLPFSMSSRSADAGARVSALPDALTEVMEHGRFGVHLFLVVSGFCIHMAWARQPSAEAHVSFAAFWKRRLHRLYPPYVVALLLSLAGMFTLHAMLGHESGSLARMFGYSAAPQFALDLVLLLLLAQNLNGASQRVGNGPFWTLALEEQLYALYFPLLWMRRKLGWGRALAIVAGITLVWRLVASFLAADWFPAMLVVGPARWFEWALGALAVEIHLGRAEVPRWARDGAVGTGLLAVAVGLVNLRRFGIDVRFIHPLSDPLFGVALFVIVNAACKRDWAGTTGGSLSRFFAWVGTFSYSLYLTHQPVIVAAKHAGLRLGLGVPAILILRGVGAMTVAYAFFMVVERRFLNASRPALSEIARSSTSSRAEPPRRAAS